MMRKTAKSMAVCVMAFLFLCGCSYNREEFVNTQNDPANEYFGTVSDAGNAAAEDAGGTGSASGSAGGIRSGGETASKSTESTAKQIFIYVCGAVREPGVYVLTEGARVYEAIRMAGGMLPEANEALVNQARVLVDGEQITVFTKEETEGLDPETFEYVSPMEQMPAAQGKVNINTATAEELMTLSGIGEARAGAIIEYRETNGAFRDIADIMKISGIGEALYNKIKDNIVVS